MENNLKSGDLGFSPAFRQSLAEYSHSLDLIKDNCRASLIIYDLGVEDEKASNLCVASSNYLVLS